MIIIRAKGQPKPARPILDRLAAFDTINHAEKLYRELLKPKQFKPFVLIADEHVIIGGEIFWLWKNWAVVHVIMNRAVKKRFLAECFADGAQTLIVDKQRRYRGKLAGGGRRPRLPAWRGEPPIIKRLRK